MPSVAVPGLRLVGAPDALPRRAPLRLVGDGEQLGRRLVGVTTLLGVVALAVLLGLALFHSALAEGQYRLSQVEADVESERQHIIDLQYELEALNAPSEVLLMAEGVLGLVSASEPIDLNVDPLHIDATARVQNETLNGQGTDWLTVRHLLTHP